MSERYVGRVPAEPSPAGRAVARARPGRGPRSSAQEPAVVRGVATPEPPTVVRGVATPEPPTAARGVATPEPPAVVVGVAAPAAPTAAAEPVDGATALIQSPDVTAAIFVDGSGRRGRRLLRTVYALIALGLLLILAFWVVQGVDLFGSST